MNRIVLILLIFLLTFFKVFAQNRIEIISSDDGKPVISANVKLKCIAGNCKDSLKLLRTSAKGFVINPFKEKTAINVSYIGYKTHIDTLEKNTSKTITLEVQPITLHDIVTTGQYVPQSAQSSVFPVKVITEERIQGQAASNLRDLFTNEMSIKVSQDNILGAGMSINGISGQNVKIMVDGVPIIGRLNGNIDISQINLNNVERVEIIEGPMSTIYGSDALGGVVNIITKTKFDDKWRFKSNSFYESVGTYNFDGDVAISLSNEDKLNISGGRNYFNGFSPIDTSRAKLWKPKEQYFGSFNLSHRFDKAVIKYNFDYFYEYILSKGNPREPYLETAFDDHFKTFRMKNSLYYQGEISNNKFLDITLSYSNFKRLKNTFLRDLTTLTNILTNSDNDQDTSTFNNLLFRTTYSSDGYLPNLSYQSGFEFNYDNASGARISNAITSVQDYAFFTSIQYVPFEKFTIQPAFRLISNTLYKAPIIPSINLKYEFNDKLKIRAAYSKGFRAPTLKELYFLFVDVNHNIQGNQNLLAETSDSYNAVMSYMIQREASVYKIEPKIFYNNIYNQISLATVSNNLYSYVNLGNFKSLGAELKVQYIVDGMMINFGYSYLGRKSTLSDNIESPDFKYTSELTAGLIYDIKAIESKFSIFYKYSGKQPGYSIDANKNIQEYTISDYSMIDATISKNIFEKYLNITIGVKNLLNVTNITNTGSFSQGPHSSDTGSTPFAYGRTFISTLKINLNDGILD